MIVTAWEVHNVHVTDPVPKVPWAWQGVRCDFHTEFAPAADGLVLRDGTWRPMCSAGLKVARRDAHPWAEVASADDDEPDEPVWEGVSEEGRDHHRTVGPHRAWSDYSQGWCYPADPCEWCRGARGETQMWLPATDSPDGQALAVRLSARIPHADWCCTKGCAQDGGMHQDVEFSDAQPVLSGIYPCPGTCTCGVLDMVRATLAALREEEA